MSRNHDTADEAEAETETEAETTPRHTGRLRLTPPTSAHGGKLTRSSGARYSVVVGFADAADGRDVRFAEEVLREV